MSFAAILEQGLSRRQGLREACPRLHRAARLAMELPEQAAPPPSASPRAAAARYAEHAAAMPAQPERAACAAAAAIDVAAELRIAGARTRRELERLRRRYAWHHHPDRAGPEQRERALLRLQIANSLIDAAIHALPAA